MDSNKIYIEETEQFIYDTLQGKYTAPSCQIQQWQELRYNYSMEENVSCVDESVILYGLSR